MDMDNDLDNLQNDKYVSQIELQKKMKLELKEKEDFERKNEKQKNKAIKNEKRLEHQQKINDKNKEKQDKIEEQNEIEEENQFLGKNKRQLINSILKYKELFSELKNFKIKKDSNVEELQQYIQEMQCVIETSTIDSFLMDSIYVAMSSIEGITSKTKYNISGLSNILKSNKQFNSLCKQMMLKYNCYSNVSIEYQTLLIIISSVYITVQKNSNRQNIENYLNEKI